MAPGKLRYMRLTHRTFTGATRPGELIVHRDAVPAVRRAFARLYRRRFPIRRTEHAYGRAIDVNPIENPYVRFSASGR